MTLEGIVRMARERGASDIHLEGGMPAAFRVRGELKTVGDPVPSSALTAMAREVIGEGEWHLFLERCSWDLSRTVGGARCRINVLRTSRGVGFAIRLLGSFQATLAKLNLHPELRRVIQPSHGLVLITGPTGSGKTSTLAALLQEVNLSEARHIITVEQPIEYALTPRQSFIRQREVGRDTPSFEQALIDSLREDPDVLMVGEMREPGVMRLTLGAAETGHLVLATMHSSSAAEALQRIVSSFPAELQGAICAQLADTLVAVVAQRLSWRPERGIRVPECELLMASTPVRAMIRGGHFYKLQSTMETGAADGMLTFARYAEWLARKTDWHVPSSQPAPDEPAPEAMTLERAQPIARAAPSPIARTLPSADARTAPSRSPPPRPPAAAASEDGVLELSEEDDPESILREMERRGK